MIDPDSTQAVPAPGRHRVRHWEDTEGYRTRPPYSPPAAPSRPSTTDPGPPTPRPGPPAAAPAAPAAQPGSSTTGPPAGSGPGRLVYREEALRRHVETRATVRMPLVISGPSFLLLWIVVAAVLAAGAVLITLALGAGG
ncbi:hypothetical protein ACSDR0_10075 [Streptosporangium sp. G11]|uniref:hypothetical protein n=1 Tax=Streptosporangium sp. G11 TaxID=3436926 RepID=UPI003EB99FE1